MRLPRIAERVYAEPWLIRPEAHHRIQELLEERDGLRGGEPAAFEEFFAAPKPLEAIDAGNGVRVLPISGILGRGLSNLEINCGGADMERIGAAVDALRRDASAETVILAIDSPGGTVNGTPELGARVARLAEAKETLAFTSGMMASAAYWIGAQARAVVATPSAAVGSIGVYSAFLDTSRALEAMGVRVELVKAGRLKAAGMPGRALTDEERAYFQERVDKTYRDFRAAIGHRGIDDETAQGQVFDGDEAVERNLVDWTEGSLDDLIEAVKLGAGL